jgi:1-deoxyxylulose-5-phosphate synthase
VLARAAGNSVLNDILVSIRSLLRVWIRRAINEAGETTSTVEEHQAIFDAILARSPSRSTEAMRAHLDSLLGPTGVRVSRICIGTGTYGVAPTERAADRVIHAALDEGINFFDTANTYGNLPKFDRPGIPPAAEREPAERILGRALAGRRDEVVLATKSGEPANPTPTGQGLSRKHIFQQLENSLRRLGTDYIDLYYAHLPDPQTPLEQTLSAYDDLVRQGKVRYVALSNHPAWQLTHALWIADDRRYNAPVCTQSRYNLVDRRVEREIVPACVRFGLSIVAYSSLHGGLLAGSDVVAREYSGWKRWREAGFSEAELEIGRRVETLSQEWGLQPHQVSLAWLLSRPAVASAIVGAETVEEVEANAEAASVRLTQEQLDSLTELGVDATA